MNYVAYLNQLLKRKLAETPNVVSFGQNIVTGSCLGGLTRALPTGNGNMAINTTNSEYTLTGAGFGLMAEGVNGIFFMKQQDFLLLGMDHLVHTWNALRTRNLLGSFTIFAIVVDNGYEGPQSCINNLADFCSVSHIPGYTISNQDDADSIIGQKLIAPGVRIIGVSQRLFKSPMESLGTGGILVDAEDFIRRYGSGDKSTVISLNFAFGEAMRLAEMMGAKGLAASVFNVPAATPRSWSAVIEHARQTRRVIICDDTKSLHKPSTRLAYMLKSQMPDCEVRVDERVRDDTWSWPNADRYEAALPSEFAA